MAIPGTRIGPDMTVRDILARYPETIPVLCNYGLDRCCADLTLREAARRRGLDVTRLLWALDTLTGR